MLQKDHSDVDDELFSYGRNKIAKSYIYTRNVNELANVDVEDAAEELHVVA